MLKITLQLSGCAAVVLAVACTAVPITAYAQATTPANSSATTGVSKLDANPSQLQKIDRKVGTGAEAVAGKGVIVHYTGWLYDPASPEGKGAKFDSSVDRKVPFQFPLGSGKVIKVGTMVSPA